MSATLSYIRLTPRWQPLDFKPEQCRLQESDARFKIVPAGRRSGKTEIAKRHLALSLIWAKLKPKAWIDQRFFAAAPTRDQAKRVFWNDLKQLVPKNWLKDYPSETDLCIRTWWGAELWVIGLDKPQRVEGTPWDGCVLDEFADVKPGAWDAHIRPALADRKGWAWLIGVPDKDAPGQIEYEKMVNDARSGLDPQWGFFHWPSSDILDPSEIESARRSMDPRIFEQEFLGKFILASGRAFPDFDEKIHCAEPQTYDPSLPLTWSLDFNIAEGAPACSGIIQFRGDVVRVIDEMAIDRVQTETVCDEFLDRAKRNDWNLVNLQVYGDATGNAKDTTSGKSDWSIIRNRLKNYEPSIRVPMSNSHLKDTVNAVNAKLKNADGKTTLFIDPKCRRLIKDLRSALWPSDLEEQHAVAWLRYFVQREFPVLTDYGKPKPMTVGFSAGFRPQGFPPARR